MTTRDGRQSKQVVQFFISVQVSSIHIFLVCTINVLESNNNFLLHFFLLGPNIWFFLVLNFIYAWKLCWVTIHLSGVTLQFRSDSFV